MQILEWHRQSSHSPPWLRTRATRAFPITPAQIANERFSEFWLTPGSTDIPQDAVRNTKDGIVAGFTAGNPGRLWKFMTGHLQKLQSPISKSYFESRLSLSRFQLSGPAF